MPARRSLDLFVRLAAAVGATAALAGALHAQTVPDQVRDQVASARLGAGYAQMINLSATPDLSAASYRIDGLDPGPELDVLRLPYQAKWLPLSDEADLYWEVEAGGLRFRQDFPWYPTPDPAGTFGGRWTAYSVGAGVLAKVMLGSGFSIEPAIDVALARLQNRASYSGSATVLQPVLDGLLFNWDADGSYAGFFGANRHVLGFDAVAEVGGGLEMPIAPDAPKAERVRFQAAYLFGSGVRGWTLGLGIQY